jgi:hypothetical protein
MTGRQQERWTMQRQGLAKMRVGTPDPRSQKDSQ